MSYPYPWNTENSYLNICKCLSAYICTLGHSSIE